MYRTAFSEGGLTSEISRLPGEARRDCQQYTPTAESCCLQRGRHVGFIEKLGRPAMNLWGFLRLAETTFLLVNQLLKLDPVITLQHDGVSIDQDIERQQPDNGIEPTLEQSIADKPK